MTAKNAPPGDYLFVEEKLSFFNFPLFQWKFFAIFIFIASIVITHWFYTSSLFAIPKRLQGSRTAFFQALNHYYSNKIYWDAKQNNFCLSLQEAFIHHDAEKALDLLNQASSEVLISFLSDKFQYTEKQLKNLTVSPIESSSSFTIMISKYESQVWPLKILLSLEMQINSTGNKLVVNPTRLRRGSRELGLGLSWAYFGPEIAKLKQLEKVM